MSLPEQNSIIARGRTADVYAWQDHQILKLLYDWCPLEMAEEEARIAQIVSATSIPTPKFIGRTSIDGRQGLIYERVEGSEMLEQLSRRPWQLASLARQMAELHAAIHHQSGDGFLPLRPSVRATIERVDGLPPKVKTGALAALDRLPDGGALCHFDFHPGQIMTTNRGLVMLDWMTAKQGDPAGDVARTWVLFKFAEIAGAGPLTRLVIQGVRGMFFKRYLARYLDLQPQVGLQTIQAWMIPVAAARLAENIPGERPLILAYLERLLSAQA
jgi:aminoglycoside phosphotransferase (APT) family kinase protein